MTRRARTGKVFMDTLSRTTSRMEGEDSTLRSAYRNGKVLGDTLKSHKLWVMVVMMA